MPSFIRQLSIATWLVALVAPFAAAQTVYDIDTLTDDAGLANAGDGLCAIREAIANINTDADQSGGDCPMAGVSIDTLTFSVTGTIVLDGAPLVITSNVVFSGPGHDMLEISGDNASRVIEVDGGVAILRRIGIKEGNSDHGAIWLKGPNLLLIDRCAIYDNTSTGEGGGVNHTHSDGNLIISNSTIYNNQAANVGGGLFAEGPTESVSNVTFSGNYAASGGGAIWIDSDSLIANNLTVFNNTSDALAGGIHVDSYLEMKHSIVVGNWDLQSGVYLDCTFDATGEFENAGYNLVGENTGCKTVATDKKTEAPTYELDDELKVNGSGVPTHALIFGSQAIDAGDTINGGTVTGGCARTPTGGIGIDARFLPRAKGVGMGGSICDIGAFEAQNEIVGVNAEIEMFMEGPYVGGFSMDTGHGFADNLTQGQIYRASLFNGSDLDYDGIEAIDYNNFPTGIIDWVLVSLRSGTDAASEVARGVGQLFEDGTLRGMGGKSMTFSGVTPGPYYVVVDHWSHLAAMSPDPVDFSSGTGSIIFGQTPGYSGGGTAQKDLGGGVYGLFACDVNFDRQITAPDFNLWNAATTSGVTGYAQGDCNMDGIVTAPDFNLWNANTTAGAASQVPD